MLQVTDSAAATLAETRSTMGIPDHFGLRIFRGQTESELYVAVQVEAGDQAPALDRKLPIPEDWSVLVERAQQPPDQNLPLLELQQMQQQQTRL